MSSRAHARRYAQAVFEIALAKKELDRWQSDLVKITTLVKNADLIALLENPKLRSADKTKLLTEQLSGANPLALNLVHLLLLRGRLNLATDIAAEFQHLLDSYRGIEPAEVTTATLLDDKEKTRLAERLGTMLNKKVRLATEVDTNLLGGVVVRVGGKLLDGSTHSQLENLRKALAGGCR